MTEQLRTTDVSDEELIHALKMGDNDSLGILVSRWEGRLHRFVSRMLPRQEDARDVCQETFLRILKKAGRFRAGSNFSTWMYQIALNLCRDNQRRRRRWGFLLAENHEVNDQTIPAVRDTAADPSTIVERTQLEQAVAKALKQIPHLQREVLILKEYEGLKFREISAILGCAESTVKSRMYGGLKGLRKSLINEGITGTTGVG
jgi:RNA polymerase sigma-70 factor (ECF subfamily)